MNRMVKNTKHILLLTFICLFCAAAFLWCLPKTGSAAWAAQEVLLVADTDPDMAGSDTVTSTETPATSSQPAAGTEQEQTSATGLNAKKGIVLAIFLIISYLAGRSSYNKVAKKNKNSR